MTLFSRIRRFVGNLVALNKGREIDLWVDDLRPPPAGWYWATDIDEAMNMLVSCVVRRLSLDHDMGAGYDMDAYRLVYKLVEVQELYGVRFWPLEKPVLHTANPVGRDNMGALIDRYGPYNKED